jgi:hypothetical protein
MKIQTVKISSLTLDPENARKHSSKNLDVIAESLQRFGQRKPVVVSVDNVVLAGNGTVEAARKLGWKEISITFAPVEWDRATAKAYALTDNRTAELSEWDIGVLNTSLMELAGTEWDISALGFEMPQVLGLDAINEGELPDLPEIPITQIGDVYQLEKHRLICGDATDQLVLEKLMEGNLADLVWTDPPYGVAYVGKTKEALTIDNDRLDHVALTAFLHLAFRNIFTHTQRKALVGMSLHLLVIFFNASLFH